MWKGFCAFERVQSSAAWPRTWSYLSCSATWNRPLVTLTRGPRQRAWSSKVPTNSCPNRLLMIKHVMKYQQKDLPCNCRGPRISLEQNRYSSNRRPCLLPPDRHWWWTPSRPRLPNCWYLWIHWRCHCPPLSLFQLRRKWLPQPLPTCPKCHRCHRCRKVHYCHHRYSEKETGKCLRKYVRTWRAMTACLGPDASCKGVWRSWIGKVGLKVSDRKCRKGPLKGWGTWFKNKFFWEWKAYTYKSHDFLTVLVTLGSAICQAGILPDVLIQCIMKMNWNAYPGEIRFDRNCTPSSTETSSSKIQWAQRFHIRHEFVHVHWKINITYIFLISNQKGYSVI